MATYNIQEKHKSDFDTLYSPTGDYKDLTLHDTDVRIIKRGYASIDAVETNAVMFIGINPSYKEEPAPISHFYQMSQEGGNGYWNVFKDLTPKGLPWAHIDLLVCRETKQELVEKMAGHTLGVNFILAHLDIAKTIIEAAKPLIIVVSNTLARRLMGKQRHMGKDDKEHDIWMGLRFTFDDQIGTDRITDGPLANTPVFFTSMLTGQRALDNGSEERLRWHIKMVSERIG
jgi:hypothetical protein